jgi:DNA-binding transcriptional LysR family regulator
MNFDGRLRLVRPPVPLEPITEIMVWTPRTARDPGAAWLRDRIRKLVASDWVDDSHQR